MKDRKDELFKMKILNIEIRRLFPRYAVRKAIEIFGDRPIVAIEVGTYKGEHALSMLNFLNISRLYLVDAYMPYRQIDYGFEKDNNNSVGKEMVELQKAMLCASNRLSHYANNVKFIVKDSLDAANNIHEKADFIYIDGNHDYSFVKRDLITYYPFLNLGGIISGHDAHLIPVMKAVAEFCYENSLSLSVRDSDWVIFKDGVKK